MHPSAFEASPVIIFRAQTSVAQTQGSHCSAQAELLGTQHPSNLCVTMCKMVGNPLQSRAHVQSGSPVSWVAKHMSRQRLPAPSALGPQQSPFQHLRRRVLCSKPMQMSQAATLQALHIALTLVILLSQTSTTLVRSVTSAPADFDCIPATPPLSRHAPRRASATCVPSNPQQHAGASTSTGNP